MPPRSSALTAAAAGSSSSSTVGVDPSAASSSSLALARLGDGKALVPNGLSTLPGAAGSGGKQGKIPAFLQKLYTMVDSPETNSLIYWSDGGDSFFVPNHEAFGKELLPRFFKHSNFSSFVRQLNMYGFHKVPHMQQGVLEPNSSSELWEFTNPNFQRDQQHLLPLVTRKKALHPTIEHPDGAGGPGGDDGPSGSGSGSGKGVDVPAILNSIATIRAQQTALSADLKELQQSNQHLWTEALAARERHKQHQDTTDRILRFLAGVFGQGAAGDIASGVNGDSGNQSVSSAVRAAKESMLASSLASGGVSAGAGVSGARSGSTTGAGSSGILARNRGLMIQAGQAKTPSLAADNDGLQSTLTHEEPLEEISADRFMEVQTTPTPTPSTEQGAPSPFPPTLARSTSTALVPRVAQPQDQQPSSYHPQPNGDIGQYFNFSGQPQSGGSSTALDAFTPSFLADFASAVGPLSPATLGALSAPTPQSDPAGVSSTALQQQQAASSQALERSYQSADAISTEVDTLQASIEDLVASLGLSGEMRSDGTWDPPPAEHVSDVAGQYTGSDFDMESFLSDLTGSAPTPAATTGATPSAIPEVNSSEQSPTSSLGADESPALVPTIETPGTTATGTTVASPQTDGEQSSKRSKRKSDVSLVEPDAKSQRLA